ncbi:MAG: BlaI/MecI/CopY family transcriptional regulator [Actinobacteria bacterium]|nr:BlaI/MecI/CopY family transcriptional regulator [Actinomycetota bacterium]
MSGRDGRRPAGALEGEILAALWAAAAPLTPAEVKDRLGDGLAYTTVMTALTRLHEKGAVRRRKAGRAFAYAPTLDEAGMTAARMNELLGSGAEREAVLARFVGTLSSEDERLLAELLSAGRQEDPEAP